MMMGGKDPAHLWPRGVASLPIPGAASAAVHLSVGESGLFNTKFGHLSRTRCPHHHECV